MHMMYNIFIVLDAKYCHMKKQYSDMYIHRTYMISLYYAIVNYEVAFKLS